MLKNNFDFFKLIFGCKHQSTIVNPLHFTVSSFVLKFGNYQNWKNAHAVCFQNKQ